MATFSRNRWRSLSTTIQTGGAAVGKTIDAVSQTGAALDFADQSAWKVAAAVETSSVLARDKGGKMIYTD